MIWVDWDIKEPIRLNLVPVGLHRILAYLIQVYLARQDCRHRILRAVLQGTVPTMDKVLPLWTRRRVMQAMQLEMQQAM
jgi:hypothetical protein